MAVPVEVLVLVRMAVEVAAAAAVVVILVFIIFLFIIIWCPLCDGYSRLARHPSLKGLRLRSWHLECGATSEASMLKPLNRGALFQDAASERPRLRGASPEAVEIHLAR